MRGIRLLASLALIVSSSCAAQTSSPQIWETAASSLCDPQAPKALVARPSDVKTKPSEHTTIASTLILMEAKYVEGPCVKEIAHFAGGMATLASGDRFVVRDDASIEVYPPMRGNQQDAAVESGHNLFGYDLRLAKRITQWLPPVAGRETYLGVFKGKFEYVIARFNVLNGKPSRETEILIRSRSPIATIDYIPFPDAPVGQIGFVQLAGKNRAWLYGYDWRHGGLRPLAM